MLLPNRRQAAEAAGLLVPRADERAYLRALERFLRAEVPRARADGGRALVQWPHDPFFWVRMMPVVEMLRRRHGVAFDAVNYLSSFGEVTWLGEAKARLHRARLRRLWRARPGERLAVDVTGAVGLEHVRRARRLLDGVRTPADLVALEVDGVVVGDLVHDTFLRFRPAPAVDVGDELLVRVLAYTLDMLEQGRRHLDAHGARFLLTSYTTYSHHGPMVRLALSRGIPVFSFGGVDPLLKRVSPAFPTHARDYTRYRATFAALSDGERNAARDKASAALETRFAGQVDAATGYMASSAYRASPEDEACTAMLRAEGKRKLVVLLHCFYDSPHIYRHMLFPDFLAWADHVLSTTGALGNTRVYVKPHPNGLPGNAAIVDALMQRHPHAVPLPARVSNLALVRGGVDAAATVYGTVAHELPWLGVPVVNAGDNPHADYAFCHHPSSVAELDALLARVDDGTLPRPDGVRGDVAEFYFMHNLHPRPGQADAAARAALWSGFDRVRDFTPSSVAELAGLESDAFARHQRTVLALAGDVLSSEGVV